MNEISFILNNLFYLKIPSNQIQLFPYYSTPLNKHLHVQQDKSDPMNYQLNPL